MIDLIATAVNMAEQGYAVFPLVEDGKVPSIKANWREISSSDPAFVAAGWPKGDNVGIDTGKSGVIVVDVDVKNVNGIKVWDYLLEKNGLDAWPDTWTVRTASGGLHFYFEAGDVEMRNSAGLIGTAIDIRAQGGYVVGWDSVVDGKPYEVIHEVPPAPVPDWLVETEARLRHKNDTLAGISRQDGLCSLQMLTETQVRAKLDGLVKNLSETPDGHRNDMLNWTAWQLGKLAAAGRIDEEGAWDLCVRATEVNGHMSWGEYGVRATFNSGFKSGLEGRR